MARASSVLAQFFQLLSGACRFGLVVAIAMAHSIPMFASKLFIISVVSLVVDFAIALAR